MRPLFDLSAFLSFRHLLRHPVEFLQNDGLATHSGHERKNQRAFRALVECRANLTIQHAAAAYAAEPHIRFNHTDHLKFAEHVLYAIGRIRPDGAQPDHADFEALIAHMLNRKTRSHPVTALQEKYDVSAVRHELFDPGVVAAAKDLREFVVNFFNYCHGFFHRAGTLQLERWPLLRHDLGAMRHRMPGIERIWMLVGWQEFLYLARIRQFDIRGDVRHEETVLAHHLWQEHPAVFADAITHQVVVEGFLG